MAPIHDACKEGDLVAVKRLLAEDPSLQAKEHWFDKTPLHFAAWHGHLAVVRFLALEAKADVAAKDMNGGTSLHLAAGNGHLEVVRFLTLEAKAELAAKGRNGWTPLHLATKNGRLQIVRFLTLEAKADVAAKTKNGLTPLHLAASNGHLEVVRFLTLEAKADVAAKDEDGWTPLHLAAHEGHLKVVRFLALEAKADVAAKNKNGQTALDLAREGDKTEVVEFLQTSTPLRRYLGVVPLELRGGADVNAHHEFGHTCLHAAAFHADIPLCQLLCEHGANLHATNQLGKEPLDLCPPDSEVAKFLGAQLHIRAAFEPVLAAGNARVLKQLIAEARPHKEAACGPLGPALATLLQQTSQHTESLAALAATQQSIAESPTDGAIQERTAQRMACVKAFQALDQHRLSHSVKTELVALANSCHAVEELRAKAQGVLAECEAEDVDDDLPEPTKVCLEWLEDVDDDLPEPPEVYLEWLEDVDDDLPETPEACLGCLEDVDDDLPETPEACLEWLEEWQQDTKAVESSTEAAAALAAMSTYLTGASSSPAAPGNPRASLDLLAASVARLHLLQPSDVRKAARCLLAVLHDIDDNLDDKLAVVSLAETTLQAQRKFIEELQRIQATGPPDVDGELDQSIREMKLLRKAVIHLRADVDEFHEEDSELPLPELKDELNAKIAELHEANTAHTMKLSVLADQAKAHFPELHAKLVVKIGSGFGQLGKLYSPRRLADYADLSTIAPGRNAVFKGTYNGELRALKEYHLAEGDGARRHLYREIEILRRVKHPNIIQVSCVFFEPRKGTVYLDMPFFEDGDLTCWLERNQDAPGRWERSRLVLYHCLQGVARLHEEEVVHADLKPGNILMRGDVAVIADFDVSLDKKQRVTTVLRRTIAAVGGTEGFIAPEVVKGKECTGAADVFAMGRVAALMASFPEVDAGPAAAAGDAAKAELCALAAILSHEAPGERPTAQEALQLAYFSTVTAEAALVTSRFKSDSSTDVATRNCPHYQRILKELLPLLGLDVPGFESGGVFERALDRSFSDECMAARGDLDVVRAGEPPQTTATPRGWIRFGLASSKAAANDARSKWNLAYHGTKPWVLPSILKTGQLCKPGVTVVGGHEITIPKGHIKKPFTRINAFTGKEELFNPMQVFMSPSIHYAQAYASESRLKLSSGARVPGLQVVLEVRAEPGSFSIGQETVGAGSDQLDPLVPNDRVEWYTEHITRHAITGILFPVALSEAIAAITPPSPAK